MSVITSLFLPERAQKKGHMGKERNSARVFFFLCVYAVLLSFVLFTLEKRNVSGKIIEKLLSQTHTPSKLEAGSLFISESRIATHCFYTLLLNFR